MEMTKQVKSSAKYLVGRVVSDKMQKTITVLIERRVTHSLYKKVIVRSRRYHVRDEKSLASCGDIVQIKECRPLSKTVSWILVQVVQQATGLSK